MWAQIINVLIGLWLMVSPAVLQLDRKAADNAHILGPVIVSMAVIALSQSVRNVRYINVLCGLWLLVAPWLLSYSQTAGYINDLLAGIAVILLSLIRGDIKHSFGGGWRSLFQDNPSHIRKADHQL